MIRSWFEIKATGPAETADKITGVLIASGSPGVLEEEKCGGKSLTAYVPADSQLDKKRRELNGRLKRYNWTCAVSLFENLDWLIKWKEHIKPVRVSDRMIVTPTWRKTARMCKGVIIEIDPGMAFGTGSHASTIMCLRAADKLSDKIKGKNVLDVGTGSGILAIAAVKLGALKVVAVDIDPEALRVARKNARLNMVSDRVRISAESLEKVRGRFHVIFANIIAEELTKIAALLKEKVAENGFLILSGILHEMANDVETAYRGLGFKLFKTYKRGEWVCFVFLHGW